MRRGNPLSTTQLTSVRSSRVALPNEGWPTRGVALRFLVVVITAVCAASFVLHGHRRLYRAGAAPIKPQVQIASNDLAPQRQVRRRPAPTAPILIHKPVEGHAGITVVSRNGADPRGR